MRPARVASAGPPYLINSLLVLTLITAAPSAAQTVPSPDVGIDQKLDAQIPVELAFLNEKGETVELKKLLGHRPTVLNLVYYRCPMLCSVAMDGAIRCMQAITLKPTEFNFITVSIDPAEKPELAKKVKKTAVRRYGRSGADDQWHFLTTPDDATVKQLADSVGFKYRYDPATKQFAHGAGMIILTPEGRISRYFLGVDYPPRDVKLSLVEASENKIGSLSDQALLLCYQYDPLTGKYRMLIHNVLRGAGFMTVMVLGGVIGGLLWRERRQRNSRPLRGSP